MGYQINWTANAGDPVLKSPFYQKYSELSFAELTPPVVAGIKVAIGQARASRESAAVINYLSWLLRQAALIGE